MDDMLVRVCVCVSAVIHKTRPCNFKSWVEHHFRTRLTRPPPGSSKTLLPSGLPPPTFVLTWLSAGALTDILQEMFALHLFFVYDNPVALVLYVLIAASIHYFFYIYLNVSTLSLLHWFWPVLPKCFWFCAWQFTSWHTTCDFPSCFLKGIWEIISLEQLRKQQGFFF